jgi:hypothetical protein
VAWRRRGERNERGERRPSSARGLVSREGEPPVTLPTIRSPHNLLILITNLPARILTALTHLRTHAVTPRYRARASQDPYCIHASANAPPPYPSTALAPVRILTAFTFPRTPAATARTRSRQSGSLLHSRFREHPPTALAPVRILTAFTLPRTPHRHTRPPRSRQSGSLLHSLIREHPPTALAPVRILTAFTLPRTPVAAARARSRQSRTLLHSLIPRTPHRHTRSPRSRQSRTLLHHSSANDRRHTPPTTLAPSQDLHHSSANDRRHTPAHRARASQDPYCIHASANAHRHTRYRARANQDPYCINHLRTPAATPAHRARASQDPYCITLPRTSPGRCAVLFALKTPRADALTAPARRGCTDVVRHDAGPRDGLFAQRARPRVRPKEKGPREKPLGALRLYSTSATG